MQKQRKIDRPRQGEDEEDQIRRVENRRLEARQERLPGIAVGIPARQVAGAQAGCGKGAPSQELLAQVGLGRADEPIGGREEHRDDSDQQQRGGPKPAPAVPSGGGQGGVHPEEGSVRRGRGAKGNRRAGA